MPPPLAPASRRYRVAPVLAACALHACGVLAALGAGGAADATEGTGAGADLWALGPTPTLRVAATRVDTWPRWLLAVALVASSALTQALDAAYLSPYVKLVLQRHARDDDNAGDGDGGGEAEAEASDSDGSDYRALLDPKREGGTAEVEAEANAKAAAARQRQARAEAHAVGVTVLRLACRYAAEVGDLMVVMSLSLQFYAVALLAEALVAALGALDHARRRG